jgi:hypothetical protein
VSWGCVSSFLLLLSRNTATKRDTIPIDANDTPTPMPILVLWLSPDAAGNVVEMLDNVEELWPRPDAVLGPFSVTETLDDVVVLPPVLELIELNILVVAEVVADLVAEVVVEVVVVAAGAPAKMNPLNCTAHTVLEVDMYVLVVVKVDSGLGWM